jgi:hypothetical protein
MNTQMYTALLVSIVVIVGISIGIKLRRTLKKRVKPLLPPTKREERLIRAFREKIAALPVEIPASDASAAEKKWIGRKTAFRQQVLRDDPRGFLSWELIVNNMQTNMDWVAEHISTFEKHAPFAPQSIIEFGAGFGALCRHIHERGFFGTYTIFDFPEFLLLQEFYLKLNNIDTSRISFVSSIDALSPKTKNGLLIAMWSLSEVGTALRENFLAKTQPSAFLIGYQPRFAEVDNLEYFKKLTESRPDLTWADIPTARFKDNHYLFGFSKDTKRSSPSRVK